MRLRNVYLLAKVTPTPAVAMVDFAKKLHLNHILNYKEELSSQSVQEDECKQQEKMADR